MQQISINVPDNQFSFMMELLKKFDFVDIGGQTVSTTESITAEIQDMIEVERAAARANPGYLLDWESVKDSL